MSSNTESSGRFHTDWLNMMYPRLKLARNLLREDGSIFISIDDNEVANLRVLMNEIFGEENFIATIVWQKKQSPQNDAINLSDMHDYIVSYACQTKSNREDSSGWQRNLLPRGQEQDQRYTNPDNDPRGDWTSVDYT
jgi:adenine-specific DNA-methyltransferase